MEVVGRVEGQGRLLVTWGVWVWTMTGTVAMARREGTDDWDSLTRRIDGE